MIGNESIKNKMRFWTSTIFQHCFAKIQRKYDWFLYCQAYNPIKRICENNPGMAYLMELTIKEWIRKNPLSDDLKHATEVFHDAMRQQNKEDKKLISG